MLEIDAGGFRFVARWEEELAPQTVAAFTRDPPLRGPDHPLPLERRVELDPLGRPRPRDRPRERHQLSAPGRARALSRRGERDGAPVPYGYCHFASKAGELWANHFATLVEGDEHLKELGRLTLWEGAQPIWFREREPSNRLLLVHRGRTHARQPGALSASNKLLLGFGEAASVASGIHGDSSMSSSLECSSGEWLTPPLRLRTKSIADSTPAAARTPASWPAPDGSSTTGSPGRSISSRRTAARARPSPPAEPVVRVLQPQLREQPVEALGRARARRPSAAPRRESRSPRPARPRAGPRWRPRRRSRRRRVANAQNVLRRCHERIVATSIGFVPAWPAAPVEARLRRR